MCEIFLYLSWKSRCPLVLVWYEDFFSWMETYKPGFKWIFSLPSKDKCMSLSHWPPILIACSNPWNHFWSFSKLSKNYRQWCNVSFQTQAAFWWRLKRDVCCSDGKTEWQTSSQERRGRDRLHSAVASLWVTATMWLPCQQCTTPD